MGRRRKLEAEDAARVKEMLWGGTAQQDIADHFGISQATVSRIQRGEQWTHIRWPDNSSGPLPIEREQQLMAQRFPGVAVRGIIMSKGDFSRRFQETQEEEEATDDEEISSVLIPDTGEREAVPTKKQMRIPLIAPKAWEAFKKLYPTVWTKDVPEDDRIKQTAVFTALTAEGAEDIPGAALRRQIDELEEQIRRQHGG